METTILWLAICGVSSFAGLSVGVGLGLLFKGVRSVS